MTQLMTQLMTHLPDHAPDHAPDGSAVRASVPVCRVCLPNPGRGGVSDVVHDAPLWGHAQVYGCTLLAGGVRGRNSHRLDPFPSAPNENGAGRVPDAVILMVVVRSTAVTGAA